MLCFDATPRRNRPVFVRRGGPVPGRLHRRLVPWTRHREGGQTSVRVDSAPSARVAGVLQSLPEFPCVARVRRLRSTPDVVGPSCRRASSATLAAIVIEPNQRPRHARGGQRGWTHPEPRACGAGS